MRVVFLGSGAFAIPPFEALLDAGHEVVALVTQPDRQKGRGRAGESVPVVMLTDVAREGAIRRSLSLIDALPEVTAPTCLVRIEEEL